MEFTPESSYAKIARACEHAELLDKQLTDWLSDAPYAVTRRVNADFTRHSMVFSVLKPPPLLHWAMMFGDVIHNLRCALDHLVYAIAVHQSHVDPPPSADTIAFPIHDAASKKMWRISQLSQPVREAIEAVQPYNRPHATLPPLLGLLRDFDDVDKHRMVKLALERPIEFRFDVAAPGLTKDDVRFESPYVDLIDGAEIAWAMTKRPMPELQIRGGITATVVIPHSPGPTGIERTGIDVLLLEDLIPEVRDVVQIVAAALTH